MPGLLVLVVRTSTAFDGGGRNGSGCSGPRHASEGSTRRIRRPGHAARGRTAVLDPAAGGVLLDNVVHVLPRANGPCPWCTSAPRRAAAAALGHVLQWPSGRVASAVCGAAGAIASSGHSVTPRSGGPRDDRQPGRAARRLTNGTRRAPPARSTGVADSRSCPAVAAQVRSGCSSARR